MRIAYIPWWRHQMRTFSALLAISAGNSPVTSEFHAQRPVTRIFDVFFGRRLNKRLRKQSWGWWFETPSSSLWRHCNSKPVDTWIMNDRASRWWSMVPVAVIPRMFSVQTRVKTEPKHLPPDIASIPVPYYVIIKNWCADVIQEQTVVIDYKKP